MGGPCWTGLGWDPRYRGNEKQAEGASWTLSDKSEYTSRLPFSSISSITIQVVTFVASSPHSCFGLLTHFPVPFFLLGPFYVTSLEVCLLKCHFSRVTLLFKGLLTSTLPTLLCLPGFLGKQSNHFAQYSQHALAAQFPYSLEMLHPRNHHVQPQVTELEEPHLFKGQVCA